MSRMQQTAKSLFDRERKIKGSGGERYSKRNRAEYPRILGMNGAQGGRSTKAIKLNPACERGVVGTQENMRMIKRSRQR